MKSLPLLFAVLTLASGCTPTANASPRTQASRVAVNVTTMPAVAATKPTRFSFVGTLEPLRQADISPMVSGHVAELFIQRGVAVEANAPLLRIKDQDLRTSLELARSTLQQATLRLGRGRNLLQSAEVRAAQATLDHALDNEQRLLALAQRGSASERDVRDAIAARQSAQEQYNVTRNATESQVEGLHSARVSLEQSRRTLENAVVRAPFAGEIVELKTEVGEFIAPQTPVVRLADTRTLRAVFSVSQRDVASVRAGQAVELHCDTWPNVTWTATIQQLSSVLDPALRTRQVIAHVPNDRANARLHPGMFVTLALQSSTPVSLVKIPASAIRSLAGIDRVFVVQDGTAFTRIVHVADQAEEWAFLDDGVTPNELVVVRPPDTLMDGQRVSITPSQPSQ